MRDLPLANCATGDFDGWQIDIWLYGGAAVSLLCLGFVPDLIRQIGYDLTSFTFAPNSFKNCTPGYFSFYSMHYCSCSRYY